MKKHCFLPVVTVDKTQSKSLLLGFFSFPGCNYRFLSIEDFFLLCDQTNLENEKISNRLHTKNGKRKKIVTEFPLLGRLRQINDR